MSPDRPGPQDAPILRPRTIAPGAPEGAVTILRPRTIGALGRPSPIPIPPIATYTGAGWEPPVTGSVPVVVPEAELDDDVWSPVDLGEDQDGGRDRPGEPTEVGTAGRPPRMLRNNLFVASGTAVSRVTGLVRTLLIGSLLFKTLSDTYLGANNTPNMIYELILGGVLTATLVPLFTDDLERSKGEDATPAIISVAMLALVVTAVLAALLSPGLMYIFSRGSEPALRSDYLAVGIPLALIFAPQVFFYGLMAVWSAVLNSRQRFLAAAWAPVLNNLVCIATLLVVGKVLADRPSVADAIEDPTILWVLGGGTTLGIAIMALALFPSVRRAGVRMTFRPDIRHPAVKRAIRLSGWTFGYVIANQVAVVVIQVLAEPGSGDVTRYLMSYQLFQLPHGLLAVSIMVTFEPLLGGADSRRDHAAFNRHLLLGFRLIGLLVIPAAVGYVALPLGLDHRSFTSTGDLDFYLGLAPILAAFAVGLPGFSTYLYALRGFYAMKNTRTPFLINLFENAVNIVSAVVFVRLWGVVGLALSFSLAYTVAAIVAMVVLVRHSPGFDVRGLVSTWVRLVLSAAVMGGFVYGVVYLIHASSAIMLVPAIGAGVVVGAVVYFAIIYVLQVPGISELMTRLPGLKRFAA